MMSSIVTFQLPHYNVHVDKKRILSIIEVPIMQQGPPAQSVTTLSFGTTKYSPSGG